MNLKEKSIILYDGGDRALSTTSIPTIGKAVVGVLRHPEETKNRAVYVQDTATTLKKLAALGKKATGADGWKETVISVDEGLEQAWVELKKDKPDANNLLAKFLWSSICGEGYGGHFEKLDNELLGIKEMSDTEVEDLVKELV